MGQDCAFHEAECHKYKKKGHITRVCRSSCNLEIGDIADQPNGLTQG